MSGCAWCLRSDVPLTADHVFPRCIGGTKQLSVPACPICQTAISQAEREFARRSIFALYRIGGAPTPRKRRDAERRIIDATYVLVEDVGMGGYHEVALRIGQLPVTLPSVEVDVTGEGGARARGLVQADVARLADAVLAAMKSPPRPGGLVAEFEVELLNADDPRVNDPAFWPRIYLDLDGGMHIRARTPDEAVALLKSVIHAAQQGVLHNLPGWNVGAVEPGTIHHVAVEYDGIRVDRVIAKIPAGLIANYAESMWASEALNDVRDFVRGCATPNPPQVVEIAGPGTIDRWPDYHVAVVRASREGFRAAVSVYGGCFLVEAGAEGQSPTTLVARSSRDGSRTEFVVCHAATEIVEHVAAVLHSAGAVW